MWRVHRLDRINAQKPANLFDLRSLTLRFLEKQIGRFLSVSRQADELNSQLRDGVEPKEPSQSTRPETRAGILVGVKANGPVVCTCN